VVFGPVGLTAIVPALQAEGHDVMALPTVLLSNHPGHGKPVGHSVSADEISSMLVALEHLGAFQNLDAVLTGYFSSAEQIAVVAEFIARHRPKIVLVDPVIGDHGKLYVAESVANAIRDLLLPLASIAMPNVFELSWLTGGAVDDVESAIAVARKLHVLEVIVTSVPVDDATLGILRITPNDVSQVDTPKFSSVPNGTGDFLSGLYLARQFSSERGSVLKNCSRILQKAIELSGTTNVLAVAEAVATARQNHMID
jgi:pyridoxine kinase